MKKIIAIEGMTCSHCVATVDKALRSIPGAAGVKVDLKKNQAEMDAGTIADDAIRTVVTEAGYGVTGISEAKGGFSLFRAN